MALYPSDCHGLDRLNCHGPGGALLAQMAEAKPSAGAECNRIGMDLDKSVRTTRMVDWLLVGLTAATAVLFITLLLDLPLRATIFPWFVTSAMVIVSIVYSIGNLAKPERWDAPPPKINENGEAEDEINAASVGYIALKGRSKEITHMFLAIYGLATSIAVLGHLIAVPLFMLIYILIRREKWWFAVGGAVFMWAFIQIVFNDLMNIQFPEPYLYDWLEL